MRWNVVDNDYDNRKEFVCFATQAIHGPKIGSIEHTKVFRHCCYFFRLKSKAPTLFLFIFFSSFYLLDDVNDVHATEKSVKYRNIPSFIVALNGKWSCLNNIERMEFRNICHLAMSQSKLHGFEWLYPKRELFFCFCFCVSGYLADLSLKRMWTSFKFCVTMWAVNKFQHFGVFCSVVVGKRVQTFHHSWEISWFAGWFFLATHW